MVKNNELDRKRIHVDMTPKDLREIADIMESKQKTTLPGESTSVYEWYIDKATKIIFHFDQERMPFK
jgi:hypothetical protein